MPKIVEIFLDCITVFFIIYILLYTTYLFLSVLIGAFQLYTKERRTQIQNELTHDYYMPVSILVPAHNEEVTIVDSIRSLLDLDYRLYEIVVVDDGSTDNTSKEVVEAYNMRQVNRPIHRRISCKQEKEIYEAEINGIMLTLIVKENGGKGDALNMGINASQFPYFLCIDADSVLQRDSLEKIAQPLLADENIVAIDGLSYTKGSAYSYAGVRI